MLLHEMADACQWNICLTYVHWLYRLRQLSIPDSFLFPILNLHSFADTRFHCISDSHWKLPFLHGFSEHHIHPCPPGSYNHIDIPLPLNQQKSFYNLMISHKTAVENNNKNIIFMAHLCHPEFYTSHLQSPTFSIAQTV